MSLVLQINVFSISSLHMRSQNTNSKAFRNIEARDFSLFVSVLASTSVVGVPSFKLVEIYNLAFVDKLSFQSLKA